MLLPCDQAHRFIEGYKAVLLRILANARKRRTKSMSRDLADARALMWSEPHRLDAALVDLASENLAVEPPVVAAMRTLKLDRWIYLRQGKTLAVFLDKAIRNAYAVRALTTPLNELLDELPVLLETGLLEFEKRFICDGLVLSPTILGSNYRAEFNAAYTRIRKDGNFHAHPAA